MCGHLHFFVVERDFCYIVFVQSFSLRSIFEY